MDKEIKAKVEEFVKNFKKRELSKSELDQVVGGTKDTPDGFPAEPTRYPYPGIDFEQMLKELLESMTEEELEALKAGQTEGPDMTWLEEYLKKNLKQ